VVNKGLQCVEDYFKISGPNSCQVKAHSKPWIVSLRQQKNKRQWCAGTLIGSNLVLTAAHCICYRWEIRPNCSIWKTISVIAGDHDLKQIDEGEQEIDVKYGHAHEKWRQSM
jgi:secreted trypsin-like serine protease